MDATPMEAHGEHDVDKLDFVTISKKVSTKKGILHNIIFAFGLCFFVDFPRNFVAVRSMLLGRPLSTNRL